MSWKNPIKPQNDPLGILEEDAPQSDPLGILEKKSQNSNGLNGQQEQSEPPAATTSASEDYSGKRPAAYALPDQPKPSGFAPKINLGESQQAQGIAPVQPVPQKSPIDILKEDYYANKVSVDKSLTSTVGDDEAFGKYVPNDSLFNAMVDPRNPDNKLISKYSTKRQKDLDNEFNARKEVLDSKYPQPKPIDIPRSPSFQPAREEKYYEELDNLKKEIDSRKKQITDAAWDINANKAFILESQKVSQPKFTNKEVARYMRRGVGDPTLDAEERYESKGIELSPSQKYYNDKVGYLAKATALKNLREKGVDIFNNPAAMQLFESVKDGKAKLLADHKDFTKQQASNLISDQITKDKNWLQLMSGAYDITDKDIKNAAKKLGIPDDIAEQVHDEDIKTANIFGTFANELFMRPGANIGTAIGRPFRREILGQDPDAINAHYEALNKQYTTLLAENPDAQSQFSNPTEIEKDPTSESYLEDIRNTKAGKFNWDIPTIANSIANGAGQMFQYGLGGSAVGGGLKAIRAINNLEKAKDVGLVTYGFINSYEPGYQLGRQLVGDDPSKEWQRNVIGTLDAFIQSVTELIYKDTKVTDKLFNIKNAGVPRLLDLLAKSKAEDLAKTLTSATGKKTLTEIIKNGVVKTGVGTVKEISEDQAALIGDIAISAVANPKSLEGRDIPDEFLQTAITTGISSIIPIGVGEMRQTNHTSGIKKSAVYEIGFDPDTYISHIGKEAADGKIPQELANKKISIVNTMADIVKKDVPNVSPINYNPLSEKDKIDYSYNLLHATMLNKKLEETTDEVQHGIINQQLKDLKLERQQILQNADGIEKNFNGQPIYDRDQKPEPTKEEQTKEILEGKMAHFTYDNESQVPELFKDHISSTGENNGKKFVRVTVAQSLADYALSRGQQGAAPIKTENETDYTGKDNNFLANKEEGFFNPKERETYNELMKTPETEAQAAQMVADKKEELKKFAPKPEANVSDIEKEKNKELDKLTEKTQESVNKQLNLPVTRVPEKEVSVAINKAYEDHKEDIAELENTDFFNDKDREEEWDNKAYELVKKLPDFLGVKTNNGKIVIYDHQDYREKGFGEGQRSVNVGNLHKATEKHQEGDNIQVHNGTGAFPAVVTKVNEHGRILEAETENNGQKQLIIRNGQILSSAEIRKSEDINSKYEKLKSEKQATPAPQETNKSKYSDLLKQIEVLHKTTPEDQNNIAVPLSKEIFADKEILSGLPKEFTGRWEDIYGALGSKRGELISQLEHLAKKEKQSVVSDLTKEAQSLLDGLTTGSKPTFITKNLERIAKENGIEVTDKMSADDVINALKEKSKPLTDKELIPETQAAAPAYRTQEEADKLINLKVVSKDDAKSFAKNFKTKVQYKDIVTGEEKTDFTFKAKDEMVSRYKKVHDLIVNCL